MINKKNIPLLIALAIPILMIILVAGFVYLPGLGKQPKYDFLYATGDNITYDYNRLYSVVSDHLVKNNLSDQTPPGYPKSINLQQGDIKLYIYKVASGQAQEVTFETARSLKLDSSRLSPDDYEVVQGNGSGDFLFGGGRDYYNQYLRGHNRSKKLNLKLSGNYPYSNFQFLGWIE